MRAMDFRILDFIQAHLRTDFFDAVLPAITKLGDSGMIWIFIAVVCLFYANTRKMAVQMLLALLFGLLLGNMTIKPFIARERPFTYFPEMVLLIPQPSEFSFPSGHTLSSFAAAFTILRYYKREGIAALVLAGLIAFSRLYLYVHFPSDIVGGIIIGWFVAWLAQQIMQIRANRKKKE